MAPRRPPHSIRLHIDNMSHPTSRPHPLFGRALFRWFLLVFACVAALWLCFTFLAGSPLSLPYQHQTLTPLQQDIPHRPYPPLPKPAAGNDQWPKRAQKVKDAFVHAWTGYQKYAAGYDELTPVDGGKVNNFNGWGVTLFDALDTLWLMGLHDSFRETLGFVARTNFKLTEGNYAPFFETVIRYLGGLLSAYALSGEPILLSRADDLGRMLLPAFDTPSGFPSYAVNTESGKTRTGWTGGVLWAEALSNQMEYKYLAHLTGRTDYFNKTEYVMQLMHKANITSGLFPSMWNMQNGGPNGAHYSVGAYADSAHEYLLKQYLLTAKSEPQILELYLKSVNGVINNLLYVTPTRHLLYVTDKSNGVATHKLEHLSCFFPGLLALGVHALSTTSDSSSYTERDRQIHLWAAQGLAETCWITYHDQKTGLGPDELRMVDYGSYSNPNGNPPSRGGNNGAKTLEKEKEGLWTTQLDEWEKGGKQGGVPPGVPAPGVSVPRVSADNYKERDYTTSRALYLLRPETVETFFYLWKVTGDVKWRERGWSVFESIEQHTKTKYGYSSISDVDSKTPRYKNEMPSYFMAETLKYLYLLFTDDDPVPLKDWVFNTEAHPLPIFNWSTWEKQEYNITM